MRGFLTDWRSNGDFDVDGTAVRQDWCECAFASPGSFVDVYLEYYSADVTRASSTSRTIGLAGRITAKDSLHGELVVHGYRVHVSPATHIMVAPLTGFDVLPFDDLAVGDAVEISGQALGAGIRADMLVRRGDANNVKALQYTLDEPAIEIAGRTILTQEATQVDLCEGDGAMSLSALFEKPWADMDAWLLIVVDPDSEPLIADKVIVCPSIYGEPAFDLAW